MAAETLELLQLADACFPAGGFAFSNGLECLAKLGHVKRMPDFRQYLECYLDQITSGDLPFFNSAFTEVLSEASDEAFPSGSGLSPGFVAIARDWNAWLFIPTQRRSSLSQGQAWSRAVEAAYDRADLFKLRTAFTAHNLPWHFLMIFAASLRTMGFSQEDGQTLLLHMGLRDQLGAAVRLGLLGSLQAQKMHREFIAVGEAYRLQRKEWQADRAMRSAPMIDLAQAGHTHLYSRLFQS